MLSCGRWRMSCGQRRFRLCLKRVAIWALGLGVVEMTVALHAVFDAPKDKIIWDVSHQCYPHKILTGRRSRIRDVAPKGRIERVHQTIGIAYTIVLGRPIPARRFLRRLGFAVARDLGGEGGDAIAMIGDGSMSAGMAYEAMNNAGHLGKRLIVILNDNEMSIAPPVGAMSSYLSRLYAGAPFQELKAAAKGAVSFLPEPFQEGCAAGQGDAERHDRWRDAV